MVQRTCSAPTECLGQRSTGSEDFLHGDWGEGCSDVELTEVLGGGWEMGLTDFLTCGTDLSSSCLRQNRKLERTSDLEAEERGTYYSLSSAGDANTVES